MSSIQSQPIAQSLPANPTWPSWLPHYLESGYSATLMSTHPLFPSLPSQQLESQASTFDGESFRNGDAWQPNSFPLDQTTPVDFQRIEASDCGNPNQRWSFPSLRLPTQDLANLVPQGVQPGFLDVNTMSRSTGALIDEQTAILAARNEAQRLSPSNAAGNGNGYSSLTRGVAPADRVVASTPWNPSFMVLEQRRPTTSRSYSEGVGAQRSPSASLIHRSQSQRVPHHSTTPETRARYSHYSHDL